MANIAVAFFMVNVGCGFSEALHGTGSRWQVDCEGTDWQIRGVGCLPVSNKDVVEEKK
jgi:hypothetical protein